MRITKKGIDSAVATLAAISGSVTPTLLANHDISGHTAELIGAVVAALVAAYHGGAQVAGNTPSMPSVTSVLDTELEPKTDARYQ